MLITRRIILNNFKKQYLFDLFFVPKEKRHANSIIFCIGDSHTSVFSGSGTKANQIMQPVWPEKASNKIRFLRSYRIGPATAYQSIKKINKNEILDLIKECIFSELKTSHIENNYFNLLEKIAQHLGLL